MSKGVLVNTCVFHFERVKALKETRPGRVQPVLVINLPKREQFKLFKILMPILYLSLLRGFPVSLLTNFVIFVHNSLDLFLGCNTFSNKLFAVYVKNIGVLLDDRVHDRLGEHWLIDLIVSKFSVSNKVNDNIPAIICIRIKAAVPRKKKFTYAKLLSIQQQC